MRTVRTDSWDCSHSADSSRIYGANVRFKRARRDRMELMAYQFEAVLQRIRAVAAGDLGAANLDHVVLLKRERVDPDARQEDLCDMTAQSRGSVLMNARTDGRPHSLGHVKELKPLHRVVISSKRKLVQHKRLDGSAGARELSLDSRSSREQSDLDFDSRGGKFRVHRGHWNVGSWTSKQR